MFAKSTLLALAALAAPLASAHMIMTYPVPYSDKTIDNSPLTYSNFPCKLDNGYTVTTMNKMTVGDAHTLAFKGSAIHGGGSCQLSVSLDLEPSKNSTFKVIHSIEGGCPGITAPSTFNFSLPDAIPSGKSTFAWTWFSKESGAPELYMNCAPIDVSGGASDDDAYNALPDMLVANLGDDVACTSPQGGDTKYPNPGDSVEIDNASDLAYPSGTACGSTVAASTAAATASEAHAPAATSSTLATVATPAIATPSLYSIPAAASASTPAFSYAPASTPSSGSGSGSGSNSSSSSSSSSTCSTDGAVLCNGSSLFGICDNGNVVWQSVADGTTCSDGQIVRRGVHVHRRGHGAGGY